MGSPIARPSRPPIAESELASPNQGEPTRSAASPQPKRKPRPGWKATIVRSETFAKLRAIQKSTTDPVIDLSYLANACVEMALELGADQIVKRAVASFGAARSST